MSTTCVIECQRDLYCGVARPYPWMDTMSTTSTSAISQYKLMSG